MTILKKLEKLLETEKKDLLLIEYPDGSKSRLNERLVVRQNISIAKIKKLVKLHLQLHDVYVQMKNTDDRKKLRKLAEKCTKIEFAQQKCWKFTEDKNFHNWYRVPKCSCPQMDNSDMRGTDMRYLNAECPIHGAE